MADVFEVISRNLLKWLVGIIAGLMVTGLYGGFKFYTEWKADEAAEDKEKEIMETRMFDDPNQKEEHKDHVKEAPSALEQRLKMQRDADFQKHLEEHMKAQDCLLIRLNDQYYQLKQEVKRVNN